MITFCLDDEPELVLDYKFVGKKLETGVKDTQKENHGLNMTRMARAVAKLVFRNRYEPWRVAEYFLGREKINTDLRRQVRIFTTTSGV